MTVLSTAVTVPSTGLLRPPAIVRFGAGAAEEAGHVAAAYGSNALVVTDPTLAASPHLALVAASLESAGVGVTVLDGVVPELPLASVHDALDAARRACPDVVLGLGGGSALDLAKLIALGLSTDVPIEHHYGEGVVAAPVVPVVAVPTTAGTGSEVTPVAVLSDPATDIKVGVSSPHLVPRAALVDPRLVAGVPGRSAAYAGIDALAHAIEAFTAIQRPIAAQAGRVFVGKNTLSDRFGLPAVALIGANLVAAVQGDAVAQAAMAEGSLSAGLAFATAGTAAAHALQYPVGASTKTPHGLGVGLLLPYVMAYNAAARAEELLDVGAALGLDEPTPARAVQRVWELGRAVGLPSSLAQVGLTHSELSATARRGMEVRRLMDNNPRTMDQDAALAVLTAAYHGDDPAVLM